jgi:hypothetical protein
MSDRPKTGANLKIPTAVVDTFDNIVNRIWDKKCPFGSLYLWILFFLSIYYLFFIPEIQLDVHKDGKTIDHKTVDKNLRGYLFLTVVGSGIVGYYIVNKGCSSAGEIWSGLWFLVALAITMVALQLVLAARENVTIPQGVDLLRQINQSGSL